MHAPPSPPARLATLALAFTLLLVGLAPTAAPHSSGTDALEANYSGTGSYVDMNANRQFGQTFRFDTQIMESSPSDYQVDSIDVWLDQDGTADGSVCVQLRYVQASFYLAQRCYTASSMPTSPNWVRFGFSSPVNIVPQFDHEVVIVYTGSCPTCIEAFYENPGDYLGTSYHFFEVNFGTRTTYTNLDMLFRINGVHTPAMDLTHLIATGTDSQGADLQIKWNQVDTSGLASTSMARLGTSPGSYTYQADWFQCEEGWSCYMDFWDWNQNTRYYVQACSSNSVGQECLPERSVVTDNRIPEKASTPTTGTLKSDAATLWFTSSAIDPKDKIHFQWDWDGAFSYAPSSPTLETGTGPYSYSTSHFFGTTGVFDVRARAVDVASATGPWSDPVTVTIDNSVPLQPSLSADIVEDTWTQHTGNIAMAWTAEDSTVNTVKSDVRTRHHDGTSWSAWTGYASQHAGSETVVPQEGAHTLMVQVEDDVGNLVTDSYVYRIDNLQPTQADVYAANAGAASGDNGWYVEPVVLKVSASDNSGGSGIACTKVGPAGSAWGDDVSLPCLGGGGKTVSTEGTTVWRGYARDLAGNGFTNGADVEVRLDLADPTVDVLTSPVVPWTDDPADLLFDVDFGDARSGLHSAEYQILDAPGGNVLKDWTYIVQLQSQGTSSYVTDWTIDHTALQEGRNYLQVRATDWAGRQTVVADAVEIQWDTVVPSKATPTVTTGTAGSNGWYLTDVGLEVDGDDATSGVAAEYHRRGLEGTWLGGGPSDAWDDAEEGAKTWYGRADDRAGNSLVSAPVDVKVDKTDPTSDAQTVGPVGDAGWHVGAVNVTLSATDAPSGVDAVVYRVDGGAWTTRASSNFNVPVSGDGAHLVEYYVRDEAGRQKGSAAAPDAVSFAIDATPPTSVSTVSGTLGSNGYRTSPVVVTISASDGASGVKGIWYDAGDGWTFTAQSSLDVGFSTAGTHTVRYYAVDNAGLAEADAATPDVRTVEVDLAKPETTAELGGTLGTGGWHTTPVEVTLATSDDHAGVASTRYGVDDAGVPTAYSAPFMVTAEGTTTLYYRSTDAAGRVEDLQSRTVRIDSEGADLSAWSQGPVDVTSYHQGPVNVGVTVSAGPSGIQTAESRYSYDGGTTWSTWSPMSVVSGNRYAFVIPEPANEWWPHKDQYLKYQARITDGAGNVELSAIREDFLDRSEPFVQVLSPTPGTEWGNGFRTVEWRGRDLDHDTVTYRLFLSEDGGATFPSTPIGTLTVAEDGALNTHGLAFDTSLYDDGGSYVVRVEASDGFKTVTRDQGPFSLDNTRPGVQLVSPADGTIHTSTFRLGPDPEGRTRVVGNVVLEATANDLGAGASGVNHVEFYVDGVLLASDSTTSSGRYSATWDTTLLTPGEYSVSVVSFDDAGNASLPDLRPMTVVVALS